MFTLGIVFIVLKLCGVISWSWWWVTAPIWGEITFWCCAGFLYGIAHELKRISSGR